MTPEKILKEDPHVQSSIIFGRSRFNAGAIIDPKPEYKFNPTDEEKLAAFRNAIWHVVRSVIYNVLVVNSVVCA